MTLVCAADDLSKNAFPRVLFPIVHNGEMQLIRKTIRQVDRVFVGQITRKILDFQNLKTSEWLLRRLENGVA
jgi:hypothetical protein